MLKLGSFPTTKPTEWFRSCQYFTLLRRLAYLRNISLFPCNQKEPFLWYLRSIFGYKLSCLHITTRTRARPVLDFACSSLWQKVVEIPRRGRGNVRSSFLQFLSSFHIGYCETKECVKVKLSKLISLVYKHYC